MTALPACCWPHRPVGTMPPLHTTKHYRTHPGSPVPSGCSAETARHIHWKRENATSWPGASCLAELPCWNSHKASYVSSSLSSGRPFLEPGPLYIIKLSGWSETPRLIPNFPVSFSGSSTHSVSEQSHLGHCPVPRVSHKPHLGFFYHPGA